MAGFLNPKPMEATVYMTEIPREGQMSGICIQKQSHVPLLEAFQQIRERMEAIAKGIVSDHWS